MFFDTGSEMYIIKQPYDYKMVDDYQQWNKLIRYTLAKELKQCLCVLLDKFVDEDVITKLPSSWRDFTTSLQHKT